MGLRDGLTLSVSDSLSWPHRRSWNWYIDCYRERFYVLNVPPVGALSGGDETLLVGVGLLPGVAGGVFFGEAGGGGPVMGCVGADADDPSSDDLAGLGEHADDVGPVG